jgi:hypothetical protein
MRRHMKRNWPNMSGEDADFAGDINPFLPSKLADYLVSGSKER